ncbi:MAG: AI-2E family transporter [Pseudomonadota bacterium]
MQNAPLLKLFLIVFTTIGIGWILAVGQSVILPIVTAIILVYLLGMAVTQLRRLPLFRALPSVVLNILALVVFGAVVYALSVVISSTVRDMIDRAPGYQDNINTMLAQVEGMLGLPANSILDEIVAATAGVLDVREFLLAILGGATSIGASAFMVVLYTAFLFAEKGKFTSKIFAAFPDSDQARLVEATVADINRRIGEYLGIKTLVNIILATACWAVMVVLGTDFALFWAIAIGLANYIPYVGSWIGVVFPVALSAAQTGSLWQTFVLAALLTTAQILVGNYLEPRMIGRQLNLSPFVVIVALAVWSSLWGIAGAVLAVPMTSMLVIILSQYPATRPFTVMIADRIDDEAAAAG